MSTITPEQRATNDAIVQAWHDDAPVGSPFDAAVARAFGVLVDDRSRYIVDATYVRRLADAYDVVAVGPNADVARAIAREFHALAKKLY